MLDPYPTPESLRQALTGVSRQSRENVTRLWLTEGIPLAFRNCPSAYEQMRAWLGIQLNLCPKEITLLGSARLGFSLAPPKFGRPFDAASDCDLSAVSEQLFQRLAESFDVWKRDYSEGLVHPRNNRERAFGDDNVLFGERNLPLGFIDPGKLPTFNPYPIVQNIQQAMWALTKKLEVTPEAPSPQKASIRVYRTWQALVSRVSLNLHLAVSPAQR